jgi:hypothetical protein
LNRERLKRFNHRKNAMKLARLATVAALLAPAAALAHPGHGTTPSSEAGKPPHVHFGTAGTPTSGLASRISDKDAKNPAATHTRPIADKAKRREPAR